LTEELDESAFLLLLDGALTLDEELFAVEDDDLMTLLEDELFTAEEDHLESLDPSLELRMALLEDELLVAEDEEETAELDEDGSTL
jgi:hypothetical protein